MAKSAAVVGLKCEGQFSGDGKWYAVTIEEITQYGYKVWFFCFTFGGCLPQFFCRCQIKFDMDGTVEEAPLEYLRALVPRKPKKEIPLSQQSGQLEIPEHLVIKPTDTEEEKVRRDVLRI